MTGEAHHRGLLTLAEVVARQQRELERLRDHRAAREIRCLAEGVLIEQLHCTPAEAAEHLDELAQRTGVGTVELAADLIGQRESSLPGTSSVAPGVVSTITELAGERRELGDALVAQVLHLAGAAAAALWELQPDGALEFVAGSGLSALETSRWRRIPPQLDSFTQRVARQGEPVWRSGAPDPTEHPLSPWPGGARAVLPVRGSAALLGVLEVVWSAEDHVVPPNVRRTLTTLADVTAHVLVSCPGRGRDGGPVPSERPENRWLGAVLDSGLLVQPLRDETGEVEDFEITHVAAGFTDPSGRTSAQLVGRGLVRSYPLLAVHGIVERVAEVLRTGVPSRLGRIPSSATGEAAGPGEVTVRLVPFLDGVLIDWRADHDSGRISALLGDIQRIGRLGGWEHSVVTGETTWTDETFALFGRPRSAGAPHWSQLATWVHPDDAAALRNFQAMLLERHAATVMFRLLRGDGTIRRIRAHGEPVVADTGALVSVRGIYQDLSAQYRSEIALEVTRDQLADSEQRSRQQYRVVRALQHAIMPAVAEPVQVAGLDIAVRYRPAESEHAVGGDWYDVVPLPRERALLVIGDVAGHGVGAAEGMVALRNALRGLASTGAGPGQLLSWLNGTTLRGSGCVNATVLCGLYDPRSAEFRWARAGHLPPVLVRDGRGQALPLPRGILLGADFSAVFDETTTALRPGDTLVLYTDGLIERRGVLLDESVEELARAAADGGDVEQLSDRLLTHTTTDTDDDTCLIVMRVPGGPRHQERESTP
ncbi:SpoIIE family protein phosphatase [Prauserella cavernicola]|uniref:SpoIIE family protein phosphatase n=1 Tax=Prauserella cavernicola TaxID=2800127 RepID=A0A934QML5_9PSEU|nr:SpoIIE family protein phosphatase [Prauserella cavernicola]MBK1783125.1 SpoIIE family protein phosphatase [Prauserella cavernicola]